MQEAGFSITACVCESGFQAITASNSRSNSQFSSIKRFVMYRSVLLTFSVYCLINLTFSLASTTNLTLHSFNSKPVSLLSQILPVREDTVNHQVEHLQNQNFDRQFDQDIPRSGKRYRRFGRDGCLNFPSRPSKPCKSDFVYHGVHGVFECHGKSHRI